MGEGIGFDPQCGSIADKIALNEAAWLREGEVGYGDSIGGPTGANGAWGSRGAGGGRGGDGGEAWRRPVTGEQGPLGMVSPGLKEERRRGRGREDSEDDRKE